MEAWGPPGAGAGKEEQTDVTPQAGRPWWCLGVGPVPCLAPHLSTQGLCLSFPTEMTRKPVTAVSFKGTIEGACLQAWGPQCSSWLTASVINGRLGQDNQGQQWPGPQGCTVWPRSPSPLECSKSPAEANHSFRWPPSRGLSSSHLLTAHPPRILSLTWLPRRRHKHPLLAIILFSVGIQIWLGAMPGPRELGALWRKEIHENQDWARGSCGCCLCLCVCPPLPSPKLPLP